MYLLVVLVVLCFGCREQVEVVDDASAALEVDFDYRKLPKRVVVNTGAATILEQWPAFNELSNSFDVLYDARNNEDLNLAIDDLINKERAIRDTVYPELFDRPQIKARQKVLKTAMLKLKANILDQTETTGSAVEMIAAYNAMRNQFNSISNGQLDIRLVLTEEELNQLIEENEE